MKRILEKYSKDQIKRASAVKAIFFEAIGVFAEAKIIYDETGKEILNFSSRDGHIIRYLKKAGILVGIISSHDSSIITRRCNELGLDFCHLGIIDKNSAFEKLIKHYKFKSRDIAFIGNDLDDLPVFKQAGLSVCPADTFDYIKDQVVLVTTARSGRGVVREVADLVLAAHGEFEKIVRI